MKSCFVWFLVLMTAHVPVPFPDLDGENRGIPIVSLTELQAWHPLLLGIRPNDDIDRGPLRPDDSNGPDSLPESPFGAPGVVGPSGAAAVGMGHLLAVGWTQSSDLQRTFDSPVRGSSQVAAPPPACEAECSLRRISRLCVWRI